MAPQQWAAVIIFFALILIFPSAVEGVEWKACSDNGKEYNLLSPVTLKRSTKMNWVGCVLTWVALGTISPYMFIYKCIYNLFHI